MSRSVVLALTIVGLHGTTAQAQMRPSLGFSGVPGLIDMPSGETQADGLFTMSTTIFGPITRATLSFQISPWLSGSFRLQNTKNWNRYFPDPNDYSSYNDRSFDVRLRLSEEGTYLPALALGLQDFLGTGLAAGEYLTASKTFFDHTKLHLGIGWGRYGSYGAFGSPFGTRPDAWDPAKDHGSELNASGWFRGPAAIFGGIEYQLTPKWRLKAEYSTDAYEVEAGLRRSFTRHSPLNFGAEYQWTDEVSLGLYSLYGREFGLAFHMVMDPRKRPNGLGIQGPGPVPVKSRPSRQTSPDAYDHGWVEQSDANPLLRRNLERYLEVDSIKIEDFTYTARIAQIRIRNDRLDAPAQAIGRVSRALAAVMPASVETFEIIPVVRGMATAKVTIDRSELERLEHQPDQGRLLAQSTKFSDGIQILPGGLGPDEDLYPKLRWRLMPAYRVSAPTRGDIGVRASLSYDFSPGWTISTTLYQSVLNNLDKLHTVSKGGTLPHVRSDGTEYNRHSFAVERLTLNRYARLAENIYARVSLGYLERMHAGVSGEVLWKRPDQPLAIGLEMNYTKQRNQNGFFGFDQYDYDIATAHLSAYYSFKNGYLVQLDLGRYLAGDLGATLTLEREFANGWRVGAFASKTNASAAEFGEGSFDKGIKLIIPMNWLLANPTRQRFNQTIRPITRDGGARLDIDGRLYELIRDYHRDRIMQQWEARVWR